VDDDFADRPALHRPATGGDGDVNTGATRLIDQPLHLGGGLVAEHRPVSRPANGRPQPRVPGERPAEGRVDALVHALPLPRRQPVIDAASGETQAQRLTTINDAALRVKQHEPLAVGIPVHSGISVIMHVHRVTYNAMIMY